MLMARAALLLIVQFASARLAHAQADINLSNPGAIGSNQQHRHRSRARGEPRRNVRGI